MGIYWIISGLAVGFLIGVALVVFTRLASIHRSRIHGKGFTDFEAARRMKVDEKLLNVREDKSAGEFYTHD